MKCTLNAIEGVGPAGLANEILFVYRK